MLELIILFYSILFMWTRCGYQMFLCAPPPVPVTILISFTLALPRLLPHTRSRRGTRGTERSGHVYMVRLAISGGHPPPLLLSGFLLKAAPFYCIFSSTRRALEVCTSHSSSGCSTAFFPLHYAIRCKFSIIFSITLTFLLSLLFSPNVEF